MITEPLDPDDYSHALRLRLNDERALSKRLTEKVQRCDRHIEQLIAENAALREQIQRVREVAARADALGFWIAEDILTALDGDQPKSGEPT